MFVVSLTSLSSIARPISPDLTHTAHTLVAAINAVCCKELHFYTVGWKHDRLVACLLVYFSPFFDTTDKFELCIVLGFWMACYKPERCFILHVLKKGSSIGSAKLSPLVFL